ncbi:hypothetical protein FVP00_24785, partial [Vibrio parahaemolyticus]
MFTLFAEMYANKAFKSDSQRLAVSLRSSIAKRRSHLNAALCAWRKNGIFSVLWNRLGCNGTYVSCNLAN